MSSTWDLYDSYNAMELSCLPAKQSMLESSSKTIVPSKDQEQRVPGSTIDKSKISFISVFFLNGMFHDFTCHPCTGAVLIFSVPFQYYYIAA